jgi:23S rRNA (cytosine1962-C5)-methyltransferase
MGDDPGAGATPPDSYELVDAGDGRRLERLGSLLVDRPAPGAVRPRRAPAAWSGADLRFSPSYGWDRASPPDWAARIAGLVMRLATAPDGAVGLFPEHTQHADWLAARSSERRRPDAPPAVLHLFAHTGLLTLVAARAGATVAHVDASRPAVARARENAARNSLGEAGFRWLVDDARAFVLREQRRHRRYDVIVLDPPTWGHGPGRSAGSAWRLETDLAALLAACRDIAADDAAVLLTAHATGWGAGRLADHLAAAWRCPRDRLEAGPQRIEAASGAGLDLGVYARLAA